MVACVRLNAFACRDGYILSNECMLAPLEAESAHGKMSERLGIVDCTQLPEPICSAIVEAVYRDQWAFVPLAEALGADMRIQPPEACRIRTVSGE